MSSNLYHLLCFMPATRAWEMPPALETLAQRLLATGKLRINADQERNFVRYTTANSELTFSSRELGDAALGNASRARVARLVAPAMGEQGIADVWRHLTVELKKARGVPRDKELKVARVLVQSAHPSVIELLIASGTEVFVSYHHTVADLVPVHEWQTHGTNSGMQATDSEGTAVYISAGGDPFFEGSHKTYLTDGFPALARMVVIGGQELGHFADLRRTAHGINGRHSTDVRQQRLRANPVAAAARIADMGHIEALRAAYAQAGLARLRRAEQAVAFYHARLRYSPPWLFAQAWRGLRWLQFTHRCKTLHLLHHFSCLPKLYLGSAIASYLDDMAFNLAPNAEVYRDPNPEVEEAIAVIEAVARVPQQEHKWGATAVAAAWPALSPFYNLTVLPACHSALLAMGQTQGADNSFIMNKTQRINILFRQRFGRKPGYYP